MLVFKIAHKKYADNLSVSGLAGRWNSAGKLVLYTSQNISLSLLENIIYRAGMGFNDDYKMMIIEVLGENLELTDTERLPKDWRDITFYPQLQQMGDFWYDQQQSLVLQVPSSVLPKDYNIIINTTHHEFKKNVRLIDVVNYEPDDRLEAILKKYK